jgi:hypothetical protein
VTGAAPSPPGAYRHTQFGRPVAVGSLAGIVVATLLTLALSPATIAAGKWLIVALYAVLIGAVALFGWLTVEVDAAELRLRFGIGLIRRSVPLEDIRRCELVRTRVWWSYGLHLTTSGWLYNVAGRDAVRIEMRIGRAVIIGSDDAPGLKAAIDARCGAGAQDAGEPAEPG